MQHSAKIWLRSVDDVFAAIDTKKSNIYDLMTLLNNRFEMENMEQLLLSDVLVFRNCISKLEFHVSRKILILIDILLTTHITADNRRWPV